MNLVQLRKFGDCSCTMVINGSHLNSSSPDPADTVLNRPPWVATTLGCFLIFTTVVDILGNLLVIFSVYRNKKLRNAGEPGESMRARRQSGARMITQLGLGKKEKKSETKTLVSHLQSDNDNSFS